MKKGSFILFILIIASVVDIPVASSNSDVERVIIITLDSVNNKLIFNEYDNPNYVITPNVGQLIRNGAAFTCAEAVMPTKTQVNHVTIVSGSYAEKIGIIGNYVYVPEKSGTLFFQKYDAPWKNPELIKADTIFMSMERENPDYTSAIVAGKNFVGVPIWADIQSAPAYTSDSAKIMGITAFPEIRLWDSPDKWVMNNALVVLEKEDPEIMLINLGFTDPVQHSFGHASREAWAALAWADYQVGRLIKYLVDSGKLEKTLIVVTADHGQTNTLERIPLEKELKKENIKAFILADGAFASIFLHNKDDLSLAVEILSSKNYIDGIWYGEGFEEYKIATPYTGDIAVSMAPPYEAFSKIRPPFLGIHGGLQQRFVPLIFFGPNIEMGLVLEHASLTDIVPTVCKITGYPIPDDSQGVVLPVINMSNQKAPMIKPVFIEYKPKLMSFLTLIFFVLSLLSLIPVFLIQRGNDAPVIDVNAENFDKILPLGLSTFSVIFAMGASFYSYIVNLYSIPGIQPDSFLVAMDFGIVGSFLISFTLVLLILWYAPLLFRILIQRVRGRAWNIKTVPRSLEILIVILLSFTLINTFVAIPYNYAFFIFILFFFGGLIISLGYRIYVFKNHLSDNKKRLIIITGVSGVLIIFIWFSMLTFVLFPSYLYEYGLSFF
jgi:phosphonoacetate hydrolase